MKMLAALMVAGSLVATSVSCFAQGGTGDSSPVGTPKEQLTGPETKNLPNNPSSSNNNTTLDSTKDKSQRQPR